MIGLTAGATSYRVEPNLDTRLSVSCDGTDDHVILSSASANTIKTTGSVSAWYKMDEASGNSMIFCMGTDNSNDNKIAINFSESNEFIRFNYRGGSTNSTLDYTITPSQIESAGWTHIIVTWDQTGPRKGIFINGAASASNTTAMTAYATTANTIFLGKATNADNTYWPGHFSNYSIYDRELTVADALTLYNNGVPGDLSEGIPVTGLLEWYPLDESSGNFIDLKSGGTGSVANATQGVADSPAFPA